MKIKSAAFYSVILILLLQGCSQPESEIAMAVNRQLQQYPESTLQDIYKSFFQDEFGPGHLIENDGQALDYFNNELASMTSAGNYIAEPCGAGRHFYRVPMDLVKDGKIQAEDYFSAFTESAVSYRIPDVKMWQDKWHLIVREIESMNLPIIHFEQDKLKLEDMLRNGETVVHHSEAYSATYDPHYRIMGKIQWEKLKVLI